MKFTDDELLEIVEEVTSTFGQILMTYREQTEDLTESYLDKTQVNRTQDKIDDLKRKIKDERENLKKIRDSQNRKRDLEKLRHQNTHEGKKTTQNEQKCGLNMVPVIDGVGKIAGYVLMDKNQRTFFNRKGKIVSRETRNQTFDGNGKFFGLGNHGFRLLGDQ